MAKPCSAWTRTLASVRFGDHHPPHRVGLVRLRDQFLTQARQPCLQALLLDLSEAHPVHTRSARVVASQPVGVAQDVFPADLVVEHIEAEGGLRLRLAIELPLKAPDLLRCCQAHRQSPSPHHLRKHPRSQGPLLRRRYPASTLIRPCPTPAVAIAQGDAEAATLANNGSPPITRTTFPTCRAHYPGGSSGCACRLLPRPCSLPQMAGGSASALSLSRCYGAGVEGVAPSVAEKTKQMERPDVSTERLQQIPHWPRARLYVDCRRRDELEELASGGDRAGHRTPPIEEARSRRTCVAQALASLAG